MDDKDRLVALELKQRLSRFTKLVDFRIFGSRARGDADPYSDMDVFVEVEGLDPGSKERILDAAWEVGFENFLVICPLIFTRNEVENTALRSSPIVKAISREGVPL
ncbi:MAG: nucleotidyltransferase domain-containing protein [Nitrospirota bacterium]